MASDVDSPDLDGFRDAQRRLRSKLGRTVTILTPIAPIYDPGLPAAAFDPETKLPYDPTIEPIASGYASAVASASVVFQPLTAVRRAETQADALGIESRLNVGFILDIDDMPIASAATLVELDDETWEIVDATTDGIGAKQRFILFAQRAGGQ